MSEEEILAHNKEIEIFRGHHIDEHSNVCHEKLPLYPLTVSNFHICWKWLMPIVEEISKMDCLDDVHPLEKETYYFRTFGMVDLKGEFMVRINRFTLFSSPKFIEAVYFAVVDFVTWYNKQKK